MNNNNEEIERKWLVKDIPKYISSHFDTYKKRVIEQGYVSRKPHIRIRKENNNYILNFKKSKTSSDLVREEYEFNISEQDYNNLLKKVDGVMIYKTRYEIPEKNNKIIELDVFEKNYYGLIYAEIEFDSVEEANAYVPPNWFFKEMTGISKYNNSGLSEKFVDIKEIYNS